MLNKFQLDEWAVVCLSEDNFRIAIFMKFNKLLDNIEHNLNVKYSMLCLLETTKTWRVNA